MTTFMNEATFYASTRLKELVEELCLTRGPAEFADQAFPNVVNWMAVMVNAWAESKGWNEDDPARLLDPGNPEMAQRRLQYDAMKLALMHSELSEALEGLRHGNAPSDHIPEFSSVEEELADTVIRILHFAGQRQLRLGEAIRAKMEYNATRAHKHGKQC